MHSGVKYFNQNTSWDERFHYFPLCCLFYRQIRQSYEHFLFMSLHCDVIRSHVCCTKAWFPCFTWVDFVFCPKLVFISPWARPPRLRGLWLAARPSIKRLPLCDWPARSDVTHHQPPPLPDEEEIPNTYNFSDQKKPPLPDCSQTETPWEDWPRPPVGDVDRGGRSCTYRGALAHRYCSVEQQQWTCWLFSSSLRQHYTQTCACADVPWPAAACLLVY